MTATNLEKLNKNCKTLKTANFFQPAARFYSCFTHISANTHENKKFCENLVLKSFKILCSGPQTLYGALSKIDKLSDPTQIIRQKNDNRT